MASDEVYEFTIVTPAGTLKSAPLVTPTILPSRIVERIEWRVPSGALGVMGWQISMRGVQVIPRNAGGFIVAHERARGWNLKDQPDSGDWSVTTYNTGTFPHALYVTYFARVIAPVIPELRLSDDLSLSGDAPAGYVRY